jgi:hypothetical protein
MRKLRSNPINNPIWPSDGLPLGERPILFTVDPYE